MNKKLTFSLAHAYRHLRKVDPVVGRLIDKIGPFTPRPDNGDPYERMVRSILYQQLAGAAASAIQRKWFGFYGDQTATPTPAQILKTTDEQFRSCGISRQKIGYLRDLAVHASENRLPLDNLNQMTDRQIIDALTQVKGFGEWSVQMLLMFHLGRPDILPVDDLGVRNGMKLAYNFKQTPTPKQAKQIGSKWSPYATVASWYMWQILDTKTPK